jgi:hypothetical protein
MKKNKCWCYGDSFTESITIDSGSDYLLYKQIEESQPTWTYLFSDKMNLEPIINAKGGRSSQKIFMSVLQDVDKFQKGDWVIFTTSPYVRTEGINFKTKEITTYNNEQILYGRFDLGDDVYGSSHGVPIPGKNSKILFNYITEFILPFEDEWRGYWKSNFIQLHKTIQLLGINCIFWDYSLWNKFTNISQETNNELVDDHWGIDGNKQFYEFLIENINNKKYILD